MPVLVKDYEWEETETNVLIKVALKGIHSSKADVLTSSEYLKVNYRPFLFECFLHEKVDTAASSVQLKNGEVVFLLLKLTPGLWTKLQSDIIEDDMRERIHNIKEHEKQKATEEIEEWKANQKLLAEQEKAKLIKEKKALNKNTKTISKKKLPEKTKTKSDIFSDIPTRESGKIEVNFTPRVFPTPVRESQTPQEEEWLRKQAEATRIKEFMTKDLTEEEKNPLFLRDKGNKFFQDGNYLAAINIYTHAIQLDYKMPALYSNRAACHLKVKNYMKCIEDSSKALDLLLPPVPQNASSRCRAFVRRGTAFCKLELFVEGLQDYEAALKLDPSNEQLIKDAEEIRKVIQS
ncbi:dynein assembly factor 4, axonemal-like isoform X2 [Octopus sinensis]|uniref:Dynein assembly factor 4, axonemal-like isoform X2 n=1 Tax=Octopus sinensis TaxID=2607531 RepID=A0A7E6FFR0_9MOLL|nr:dynein assembly factor 4, axonemal-like isoform X2 [Octopus sinensis]